MKYSTPILAGLVLALGGGALVAFAQNYTPLAKLPIGAGGTTPATWTLSSYLVGMIKLLVASAGALAVLMLVIGGTQYVAAGINPSAKGDAKERIMNALIGLILVLTSYLILQSIDPRLVEFNLVLPPVGQTSVAVNSAASAPTAPRTNRRTNPLTQTAPTPTPTPPPPSTTTALSAAQDATTLLQNIRNSHINRDNDFSIISNCIGNTSYDLCPSTDLNGDSKTDVADVSLFGQRGQYFDVNQNRTIELANNPAAVSCFFRMPTANIHAMLPRENWNQSWSENWSNSWYLSGYSCGGGGGITGSPTVSCNGATWLKSPVLANTCAVNNGFMNMPFGFVYQGGSQFSKFQSWVTNSSSAGSSVNLTTLFRDTFFRRIASSDGMPQDEYFETDDGKLTYATIAEYDLNNDGNADFSASGADMVAFNACRGSAVSGACVRADFNQDGTIDSRDLAFVNFMHSYVFSSSGFIPLGWLLNWFESMFFDTTGYSDKQIISYCLNRRAFEKCGAADVNVDQVVNNADLTAFNASAPLLDFNGDGKVDLRL